MPGERARGAVEVHERWEEQDVKESAGNNMMTAIDVRRRGARRRRRRRRRRRTRRRMTTSTRRRPGEEGKELSELHERWDVAATPQVWIPRGDDIATYEREQRQRARQDLGRTRRGMGPLNALHGGSAEVRGALLRCVIF